jgi:hypothetical protein
MRFMGRHDAEIMIDQYVAVRWILPVLPVLSGGRSDCVAFWIIHFAAPIS